LEIKESLYGPELNQLVDQCLQEYELNMRGVNNAFNQFVFHLDINGRLQSLVANDLYKMLDVRFRSNEPRRPPRVVVVGPPGSGKTTQC
jgi:polynucleotide 5'-kinase involved in rRNA processing